MKRAERTARKSIAPRKGIGCRYSQERIGCVPFPAKELAYGIRARIKETWEGKKMDFNPPEGEA